MSLRRTDEALGAPWNRPLAGRLEQLVVDSELLAANPLGDPARRPLYVYSSPGVAAGTATDVSSVYVLQGFTGQLDAWLARPTLDMTFIERLDAIFGEPGIEPALALTRGLATPDAVVVLVDAWTALGGSQFLNSTAVGAYTDYICDEIVPFIDANYPTLANPGRRAVSGKSSGGYGAMVLPMLRPDVFGALISHSGDALFEACYLPDFPKAARALRDSFEGSLETFRRELRERDHFDYGRFGDLLNVYAMAAAYSPDPEFPTEVLLPFELGTGRLYPEVWKMWLAHDPVRMAGRYAQALRGLRYVHVEAGRSDEFHLDLGAQAFSDALTDLGVKHRLELFEGRHGGIGYRYAPAIRELLLAIEAEAR